MTRLLSVREVRAELQCARSTAHKVVAQFGQDGRLAANLVDRLRVLRPRIGYWSRVDPREAPDPDEEKYCTWCTEWWPLECFNRESRSADGRRPECRACQRQRSADLKAGAARMRPWGKRKRRALLTRVRRVP